MQIFGQPQHDGMPSAQKIQEIVGVRRRHGYAPPGLQLRPLPLVPEIERLQGPLAPPVQHRPAPLLHLLHRGAVHEVQEALPGDETARHPQKTDVTAPERHLILDPHPHGHAGYGRRFQQLFGGVQLDAIVVEHGQRAQPLDPGIHDEMRRGFPALGVDVVHMVVKGDLVRLLRHFRQMIARQHAPHHARRAQRGLAEIMRQLELLQRVALQADHILHDLKKDARRIAAQRRMRAGQHFIEKALQRAEPVTGIGAAHFQVPQQVHCGVSHAGSL